VINQYALNISNFNTQTLFKWLIYED
jgi:hypothetical protein